MAKPQNQPTPAGPSREAAAKARINAPKKTPIKNLIKRSIADLGERSGSTFQAIKKILQEKHHINLDTHLIFIKKALVSGVLKGVFMQVKGTGCNGRFKLAKAAASSKPKAAAKAKAPVAKKAAPSGSVKSKPAAKKPMPEEDSDEDSSDSPSEPESGEKPAPKKGGAPKSAPAGVKSALFKNSSEESSGEEEEKAPEKPPAAKKAPAAAQRARGAKSSDEEESTEKQRPESKSFSSDEFDGDETAVTKEASPIVQLKKLPDSSAKEEEKKAKNDLKKGRPAPKAVKTQQKKPGLVLSGESASEEEQAPKVKTVAQNGKKSAPAKSKSEEEGRSTESSADEFVKPTKAFKRPAPKSVEKENLAPAPRAARGRTAEPKKTAMKNTEPADDGWKKPVKRNRRNAAEK